MKVVDEKRIKELIKEYEALRNVKKILWEIPLLLRLEAEENEGEEYIGTLLGMDIFAKPRRSVIEGLPKNDRR